MSSPLIKGSKTALVDRTYRIRIRSSGPTIDVSAVLLGASGRVRTDDDFVFFNNPQAPGVRLVSDDEIDVDLGAVAADVDRIVIVGSTEAQGATFGQSGQFSAAVTSESQDLSFMPGALTSETVVQIAAFYRRGTDWKLDAIGQGYDRGLAALATEFGISVDEPAADTASPTTAPSVPAAVHAPSAPAPTPQPPSASAINMTKVSVSLTKDSADKTARIDLRKSKGDPNWVLTVGLEWDGRGASYDRKGNVKRYGTGDLDVYFFCRNEETNEFVVISGEAGHQGDLGVWPFMHHLGDSLGPGAGNKPATEQVRVRPTENGDLLVNVYQSVDNGTGAIDEFGRPRVAIRYGRAGHDGLPGPDADEILVYVGNSADSYWATVAHIDVLDGVLTVDGETRYSAHKSEAMPGLSSTGAWVQEPSGGPVGRSKAKNHGQGLTLYSGLCQK